MGLFNRKAAPSPETLTNEPKSESTSTGIATAANITGKHKLPIYNHNGHLVTKHIHPDGESGRKGKTPSPQITSSSCEWRTLETTGASSLATGLQSIQSILADLFLLKLCRCPSIAFPPGRLEKLLYSV
jgi:hypothetical protein